YDEGKRGFLASRTPKSDSWSLSTSLHGTYSPFEFCDLAMVAVIICVEDFRRHPAVRALKSDGTKKQFTGFCLMQAACVAKNSPFDGSTLANKLPRSCGKLIRRFGR